MAINWEVQDVKTGNKFDVAGTDRRANVSSRSDDREYYNSRDAKQMYTLVYDFQDAATGEYAFYLQNTSSTQLDLVISSVGLNGAVATRFQLHYVTGAATGGNAVTPEITNRNSQNKAVATAREGATEATGIGGLTSEGKADFAWTVADGHEEMRIGGRIRLGQDQAVALQVSETTGGDVGGVIWFYFEKK